MKISGFSMVKNGIMLYYPVVEMIKSALPLVDEFFIAVGDCTDNTREKIAAIDDRKIKIIDTKWDLQKYPRGMENAHQTDIAKNACTGDWLLYLQADEVIHENDIDKIRLACKRHLNDKEVEGLLFKYRHFWGDYNHFHQGHGWYPYEIRIIRNDPEIHSWESAQSFRRIPNFDGIHYRQKEGTFKLKVAPVDVYIYHYGWVRPPDFMISKSKALDTVHKGEKVAEEIYLKKPKEFDYGPLNRLAVFKSSHPQIMADRISEMNWKDKLQYAGKPDPSRKPHKHERFKYRLLSFVEKYFNFGKQIGGFRNYIMLKK